MQALWRDSDRLRESNLLCSSTTLLKYRKTLHALTRYSCLWRRLQLVVKKKLLNHRCQVMELVGKISPLQQTLPDPISLDSLMDTDS